MLDLFAITAPIFLLIGIGYAAVRLSVVSREQAQGLGAFVLNFALPALIIDALVSKPFGELIDVGYLGAYALGSLSAFAALFAFMMAVRRRPLSHAAIAALGGASSNSGFVGYPIALLAVGDAAAGALALNMMVENLVVIPLALALAESGLQSGGSVGAIVRATLKRLARNPIIVAIVIGMAISLSGLGLPGPLATAFSMMAAASAPAALFVIGAALVGLRLGGMFGDISAIVAAKLVLHPLAVTASFLLIPGTDPSLTAAAIILASVPMLSVYPIFGQRFGLATMCAAALMVATVLSFFTVTAVLGLLAR